MSSWYGVTDIVTYLVGAIGIILLPGPNSLYVLSVATGRGVRPGYQAACGVFLGDSILLALVGLGAAGLLHTHELLFMVVKYAGAAYLGWVGLQLLRGAWAKWRAPRAMQVDEQAPVLAPQMQQPFRRALLISLLNPKAILFLLSFFVQFIDPTYEQPWVPFLILAGIVMVLSFLYLSALILAGARLAQGFGRRQRLSAALSAAVGGLFLWFGAKLATASLH
ncbi:leucine efflux protein LeuE [Curvibacter sp. CHRR-16]|uniref:leucine efflux protein LeuE n=1 Tax=Curvibacter sp. CHRR-16 TaxID=2835872 RepID=UPI001BD93F08|nr:leucine efflux protein LeuE [Curvibacter sp. CHRR-16]MBT0570849.1 leucine efflux protein LeuE [Curvibacter sp. CHRR-16]